jgi:hypothetical protein
MVAGGAAAAPGGARVSESFYQSIRFANNSPQRPNRIFNAHP